MAFNYRFNPVHELVHRELRRGAIGDILSVHFEWLLDMRHGADYFRRWHREKDNSGGLMVHKSGHHFDLVHWWLGARPERVFGLGRLGFYGRENGERTGYRRDYDRAHGSPAAADDPFALHLADNEGLRALYLDAEKEDGYHPRPQRLRRRHHHRGRHGGPGALRHRRQHVVPPHRLLALGGLPGDVQRHRRPAGAGGRGEHVAAPRTKLTSAKGAVHGDTAMENAGGARILVRPLWQPPREVEIPEFDHAGHGGGDARMLRALFDGDMGEAAPRRRHGGGRRARAGHGACRQHRLRER